MTEMERALEADAEKLRQLTGKDHATVDAEANEFAMCLLMPREQLTADLEALGPVEIDDEEWINKLAKRYRVTPGAMAKRIRAIAQDSTS